MWHSQQTVKMFRLTTFILSILPLVAYSDTIQNVEVKETVVDAKVGVEGHLLTDIPLVLAQGASGTGDWFKGVIDRFPLKPDPSVAKLAEKQLQIYLDSKLHISEDAQLEFSALVRKYGYPVEKYTIKTDDGYILTLFRIPYGKNSPLVEGKERPVAFLMHGLMDCSDDWIILGPEHSLGYILADAGYDVWLGNARGNTHSREHVNFTPNDILFWDFSWDEIGRFDLPAMIDFALEKTGQKSLYYVGHSQGTTSFYVMCSMRPEYNSKIRLMISLAPIAWMSNMVSPFIRIISPFTTAMDWISQTLGVGELLPNNKLLSIAGGIFCNERAITKDICENRIFIVCGFDILEMNTTALPVIMGHSPSGSSVRQFMHYGQEVVSKDFRRYDYGFIENLKHYGSRVPPSYDLKKITAPVVLFYSNNDWLSNPIDVAILGKNLGNLVEMHLLSNDRFNHMDYLWANDINSVVNDEVLKYCKRY